MSTQGCSLSAWHAHSVSLGLGRCTAGRCLEGSLHAVDHSGSPTSMPGYHHIMLAFKRTSLLGWSTLKVHCMRWVALVAPPACQYTTTTHWPSRERVISHTHWSRADASHRSGLLSLAQRQPWSGSPASDMLLLCMRGLIALYACSSPGPSRRITPHLVHGQHKADASQLLSLACKGCLHVVKNPSVKWALRRHVWDHFLG